MTQKSKTPVTLITGLDAKCKEELILNVQSNLKDSKIAVIKKNDSSQDHTTDDHAVTQGCMCCVSHDEFIEHLNELKKEKSDIIIVATDTESDPVIVAETIVYKENSPDESEDYTLDAVICIVDAPKVLENINSQGVLSEESEQAHSISELFIQQVEFADIIILHNMKILDEENQGGVTALIKTLNQGARLIDQNCKDIEASELIDTQLFDFEETEQSAGWMRALEQDIEPTSDAYGVSTYRFTIDRPFHPERIYDFLQSSWDGVVRAKGFFWIATRPHLVIQLSQAGPVREYGPTGYWWTEIDPEEWPEDMEQRMMIAMQVEHSGNYGDRKQDLVFMGIDLDYLSIATQLEAALLTDEELKLQEAWTEFNDPFPDWEAVSEL